MSLDKLHIRGYQLQRIHFVPAKNADAHSIKPAELGFLCLNDPVEHPQGEMGRNSGAQTPKGKPRSQELFRLEDVPMQWRQHRRLGTGFRNLGNTCFMNSVLQCLLHTPPLAELLLSNRPLTTVKSNGNANGFDPIAITRNLLEDSMGRRKDYVAPSKHASTLRKVSRSFRMGRQEDAHEYLIALLDAMHERSIAGIPKPPPDVEFTSFIYRIFGGRIRSQVKCTQCSYESNTYDPFLDLSLEINHASSVDKALRRFTAGESLDGVNKYKCPKENRGVRAVKRITIETAPSVLVIQLKRFEFSMSGRKISKQVEFDPVLDLSPYMSQRPATPAVYDLYGVLVHQGHSMHSGHYFCFVKGGANGDWHKFDDTRVNLTAERNVLGQSAYILFYIKRQKTTPVVAGPAPRPLQPTALPNGLPKNQVQENNKAAAKRKREQEQEKQQQQQQQLVVEARKAKLALAAQQEKQQQQAKRQKMENGVRGSGGDQDQDRSHQENDDIAESDCDDDNETATPPPPRKGRAGKQGAVENNEFHTRQQQRPRPGAVPLSPLLGRRGKRLEEAKAIVRRAAHSRKALNQKPGSPVPSIKGKRAAGTLDAAEKEAGAGVTKPPPPRKRLAALAQQDRQKQSRKRKAASAAGGGDCSDGGVDDSGSYGSAVSAPDWPPVKPSNTGTAPAVANGKPRSTKASAKSGGRKSDQAAVQDFLRAGTKPTLGLDAWEDTDAGEKRQHDRLLYRAAPGRKRNDEYDEEYDRGKTKKVRGNASERGGGKLDSATFDNAFKSQQANGRPDVQLRGKKKKAAEMADRQHHQGHRQQGGRGRGGRSGRKRVIMAFNFGTPAGSSTPSFSFGGASTPAFGAAPTPGLAKTASTPLFGTPAAGSSPSLFGATSTPAFSFSTPSQPGQTTSLFGASAPAAGAPASAPAFSFPSSFGGGGSAFGAVPAGQQQQQPSLFGQPQQQQQQQQQMGNALGFPTTNPQGAAAAAPDDSAIKELQSIKDSYVPSPGNHRYRFQYLFLNVVENPAARVKPADVDELQWREALRRAGGPDNPDRLWPVQAQGFKGLLARKAAQDEAIKEHSERLQALQQGVASLAARHEAILKTQFEAVKKKHAALCQQLLRVLRYVDALEGRYAHALGYRSSTARDTLETLSKHLASVESTIAPGSTGGLQGKVDALLAAARQRAGAGAGRGIGELEAAVDPASLQSAFAILSEYAEALSKMQAVLRRNQREVAVLDTLVHGDDAMN